MHMTCTPFSHPVRNQALPCSIPISEAHGIFLLKDKFLVVTTDWTTPSIPLNIGVYRGDPLSVVTFNTVIHSRKDLTLSTSFPTLLTKSAYSWTNSPQLHSNTYLT